MLFVVGGVVAFHGIRAGVLAVPGADPAWWSQADDLSAFTEEDAQCWVVGHMQDAIVSLDQINSRRADALNLSLAYGAAAGGFILVAGAIALFR